MRTILRPAIFVMDAAFRRRSKRSHVQRPDRKIAFHSIANCPTDNAPGVQIQDHGQIQPAFARPYLADIACPFLIRLFSREVVREFDDNPNIINCQNGVVDLRTKELIEHHPSQKQMKTTKVAYDPSSCCLNFKAFLNSIFEGDQELISWMKKCFGYQLTGLVSEQVFFVAHGTGAN